MSSGPHAFEPVPLINEDQVRDIVNSHAPDPATGLCPHCQLPRCESYISAWTTLVCAGFDVRAPEESNLRASP